MKKLLASLCVCALALVCVFALPTTAQASTEGDYTYTVSDDQATITGYTGIGGDITIPSALGGYPVTQIGEAAFSECTSLTSVEIPNNVTKIGEWAFLSCNKLTTVNIPDSVSVIGEGAFYGCSYLNGVEIPNGVTKIGAEAFAGCIRLTSVTIPNSVAAIYESTFYYCENLTSVTIPNSVTYIGENAFANCTKLTDVYYDGTEEQWNTVSVEAGNEPLQNAAVHFPEPEITDYTYTVENGEATINKYYGAGGDVVIPDTLGGYPVTAIGSHAFYMCDVLVSVTIPDSVTTIGEYAFYYCSSLETVIIGNSVTTIGDCAFYCCSCLKTVTIGNSVTTIGGNAFYSCVSLTDVTLPKSVTTIQGFAFAFCDSLTSVVIPDGVTTIGEYAFESCSGLTSVTIPDSAVNIDTFAFYGCDSLNKLIIAEGSEIVRAVMVVCEYQLTEIVIPYGVTAIGNDAFKNCEKLSSVTIPDSVITIGDYAFAYCDNLTSVTIPESVMSIGDYAFNNCASLCRVTICNCLTTIGKYAFGGHPGPVPEYCHIFTNYVCNNDATCTADGTKTAKCNREGCKAEDTQSDVGSKLGHSFTNYVSNNDATCIADGTETAKCDRCEETHTRTEDGSTKGHDHKPTKVTLPTCVDEGYTTYTCHCGDSYTADYVAALNHSFTNYVSNNDATCKDGTETAKCDRCETTDTRPEVGSAKGHDYEAVVSAPTCRNGGFTTYICRRCEYAYVDDWVEPLGHSYTNACDTTCNRADCGATRTITHSYAAATCTKAKTCKVCGVTSGKALGHTYKSGRCTRCKYKPAGAKITTQPVNVAVKSGKTAKVTVKATGSGLKYQWYYAKKGSSKFTKDSVTSASYSVKMSSSVNGRKVYCVVTDKYGNTVKSKVVTLYKGTAAKIKTQPKGVTVASGKTGKLTIKASGSGLSYTWYAKNKGASSFKKVGKSSKTYSFKMTDKLDGAQVYCVVKDKYGITVKSAVVTIKLAPKARITTQPKNVTVAKGKTAKVTLKATGDGLKYTWYYAKSGSSKFKKASGKSSTYSVKMSASVNGRRVYCVVKDKYGNTVKSSIVTLKMK